MNESDQRYFLPEYNDTYTLEAEIRYDYNIALKNFNCHFSNTHCLFHAHTINNIFLNNIIIRLISSLLQDYDAFEPVLPFYLYPSLLLNIFFII